VIHKEGLPKIKDPNDIKCNICEENDATSYCQECNEFYCDGCQRGHKKGKATKSHSFISVDDGWKIVACSSNPFGSSNSQARSSYCLIHPQFEIDTFCNTDQELTCSKCVTEFHSGHIFTKIEKMATNFKDDIIPKLTQVFTSSFFLPSFFSSFFFLFNLHLYLFPFEFQSNKPKPKPQKKKKKKGARKGKTNRRRNQET